MIDMCGVNQQRNIVAWEAIKNIDKSGQNTLVGFFFDKSAIKEKVLPNKYMESLCSKDLHFGQELYNHILGHKPW
jgi:hypothetical protein